MQKSETLNELAAALAKAQSQIQGATKDKTNPHFRAAYADLASVWDACREALTKNGLSVAQTFEPVEGQAVALETTLLHQSGQFVSSKLVMPVSKFDPQGVGSAITYARRYALAAMVGVAPEDDDGESAMGRAKGNGEKQPTVKIAQTVKDQVFDQSIRCLEQADDLGLKQIWSEFDADQKVVLWGMFNSQQRTAMKKLLETM